MIENAFPISTIYGGLLVCPKIYMEVARYELDKRKN